MPIREKISTSPDSKLPSCRPFAFNKLVFRPVDGNFIAFAPYNLISLVIISTQRGLCGSVLDSGADYYLAVIGLNIPMGAVTLSQETADNTAETAIAQNDFLKIFLLLIQNHRYRKPFMHVIFLRTGAQDFLFFHFDHLDGR